MSSEDNQVIANRCVTAEYIQIFAGNFAMSLTPSYPNMAILVMEFQVWEFKVSKNNVFRGNFSKVEKILKGNLDLISSPSRSVKIQIMAGKFT